MKKSNFVSLILGAVGGILFGIGMCMCLIPAWAAFSQGIVVGAAGLVVLLAMGLVRRKMQGKPPVKITGRAVGAVLLGITGALALGVGLCMVMVWQGLLLGGIAVGVVGILMLLCLIPVCKGIQPDFMAN